MDAMLDAYVTLLGLACTLCAQVAGALGTAKVWRAEKDGKHIVSPDWLQACMLRCVVWVAQGQAPSPPWNAAPRSCSTPIMHA